MTGERHPDVIMIGVESEADKPLRAGGDGDIIAGVAPGSWGPNAIHQLIAPNTWRLPLEREWGEKTPE